MSEKDKHYRLMNILSFGPLLIFIVLSYLSRYFLWPTGTSPMDHVYVIVGSVSAWLFMVNLKSATFNSRRSCDLDISRTGETLSSIGLLLSFIPFVAGVILAVMPVSIEGLTPEAAQMVEHRVFILFLIDLAFLAFVIFCMVSFWTKFIVRENTIVVLDGKVLYPEQKFRVWPFFHHQAEKIDTEFGVKTGAMDLNCKDENITASASTIMKIDIDEAKKQGISSVNFVELAFGARDALRNIVNRRAETQTIGQLIKGSQENEKITVAGIPVLIEGKIKISTA